MERWLWPTFRSRTMENTWDMLLPAVASDWNEIYVMDLATRTLLSDHIQWAKFTGIAWQGNGFYYSAYDAPVAGKEFSNKKRIPENLLSHGRYPAEFRQAYF